MNIDFELSDYQKDIMDFVNYQKGNLLVDAKAGSGKTSTLIMIADALTKTGNKCLFLAFNKHIVEELQTKITNPNCLVKTVHSLGYSFIASYLYKKHGLNNYTLEVDTAQLRNLVREYYEKNLKKKLDLYNATGSTDADFVTSDMVNENQLSEQEMKDLHNNIITDFVNLCNYSRLYNINYREDKKGLRKLIKKFCWFLYSYIDDVFDNYQELVTDVIDKIKDMFENPEKDITGKPIYKIDYTDMLYFPVLYNMTVPYKIKEFLSTVLVDEAQDLSVLQQKFIRKLDTNFNRFIFVGDKQQSIYAFAGADTKAIDTLKETFILQQLPLNICYRCPENVIKLAQDLVPEIEWNKAREDKGTVEFVTMEEAINRIQPNDVLIGRKNRDLLSIYRKFVLEIKKPIKFRNAELVSNLINNINRVMLEYIKLYSRGLNIAKPLEEHMANWIKETGYGKGTDYYNDEVQKYAKELISENSGKSSRKAGAGVNIRYLVKCMEEYKTLGDYGKQEDDQLTEFYSIIMDFINEFKEQSSSVLVEDLKTYIKQFLSGSMYDKVPILSSVHSMKGGEADNVYIFDFPLFPYQMWGTMTEDDFQQEENLMYVAITRAKKNLYLILCDENDPKKGEKNATLNSEAMIHTEYLLKK